MYKMKQVIVCIFLLSLGFLSCTQERFIYDDTTDIAMFTSTSELFVAIEGEDDNVMEFKISSPVRTDVDRTYIVKIDMRNSEEEAKESEQFEFASSAVVTIPAGELSGAFKLRAFAHSLSELQDVVAYLILESTDNAHPVADFNKEMAVVFTRTCAFRLEDFVGKFDIYTTLIDVGNLENKISDVRIDLDPNRENGFIIRSPYEEGVDLYFRMWKTERGTYDVELDDSYLTTISSEDGSTSFNVYGFGRGIWYPCMQKMGLNYYLHEDGSTEILSYRSELFEKKD